MPSVSNVAKFESITKILKPLKFCFPDGIKSNVQVQVNSVESDYGGKLLLLNVSGITQVVLNIRRAFRPHFRRSEYLSE